MLLAAAHSLPTLHPFSWWLTGLEPQQETSFPKERTLSTEKDLEALAALIREHVEAVNSGDFDAVLAQETEDTWYLGPNAPPILGKTTLEAAVCHFSPA